MSRKATCDTAAGLAVHSRDELLAHVMSAHERLFNLLMSDRAQLWLDVDLTIQQLKTLLFTVREGTVTAGQISRQLRVGFSTVTGLVDRLAEQGLVERGEDPRDRRATRVMPTDAGRGVVDALYSYRRDGLHHVLERVSTEALGQYAAGLGGLVSAAEELARERGDADSAGAFGRSEVS